MRRRNFSASLSTRGFLNSTYTGYKSSTIHRIQELDLHFNNSEHEELWPSPLELTSLQRLRISRYSHLDQVAFHDTPALKHLPLQDLQVRESFQNLLSPCSWTTLTSLQVEKCVLVEPRSFVQVLRLTRSLTLLKIAPDARDEPLQDSLDGHGSLDGENPAYLPHLKSFHLCIEHESDLSRALLRVIQAPNLTHLQASSVNSPVRRLLQQRVQHHDPQPPPPLQFQRRPAGFQLTSHHAPPETSIPSASSTSCAGSGSRSQLSAPCARRCTGKQRG